MEVAIVLQVLGLPPAAKVEFRVLGRPCCFHFYIAWLLLFADSLIDAAVIGEQ
jgi:hypothetical protein